MLNISTLINSYTQYLPEGETLVGWDVETYAIKNGVMPEIVCFTFYDPRLTSGRGYILDPKEGAQELARLCKDPSVHLVAHNANFDSICASLLSDQLFALVMNKYDKGKMHCSKLRESMLLVGGSHNYGEVRGTIAGKFAPVSRISLAGCLLAYFGKDITASKVKTTGKGSPSGDIWRLRYHELHGVDIDQWPIEAVDYAISDAEFAVAVYLAQEIEAAKINKGLSRNRGMEVNIIADAQRQAYAEFCFMYSAAVKGVRIDPDKIDAAEASLLQQHDEMIEEIEDFNFYRKAPKEPRGYKKNEGMVRAAFDRCYSILGYNDPKIYSNPNDPTSISLSTEPRDNLLRMITSSVTSGRSIITRIPLTPDEQIELEVLGGAIGTYSDIEKRWKEMNTFIKALRNARLNGDSRIRYTLNGFVSTGRSSSKNPNLQNLPRDGAVRDCIVAQDGHIFIQSDYSNAEMRSLAEVNYMEQGADSALAVEYRKDPNFDPHLFAGYRMYNIEQGASLSFDEAKAILADKKHPLYKAMKKRRTLAKILNFGLAGGLSHVGFVSYARGYKVYLTIAESERLCKMWLDVWDEMRAYFQNRADLFKTDPMGDEYSSDADRTYIYPQSGRARYLRKYTVACNSPFQGISADGAKSAFIKVFKECYFMRKSPLYGCKPILFVHDEIVAECPYDGSQASLLKADAAARRMQEIMEQEMEIYTPHIPAVAEPTLTTKWIKDAESDVINGVIQVWSPSDDDGEAPDDESPDDEVEIDAQAKADLARVTTETITVVTALYDNHFSSAAKARAKAGK